MALLGLEIFAATRPEIAKAKVLISFGNSLWITLLLIVNSNVTILTVTTQLTRCETVWRRAERSNSHWPHSSQTEHRQKKHMSIISVNPAPSVMLRTFSGEVLLQSIHGRSCCQIRALLNRLLDTDIPTTTGTDIFNIHKVNFLKLRNTT